MKKILKSNYKIFPIVIEPVEEGGYFAYTEILQGAHAEGTTIGEAVDNIQDVIEKHLAVREKYGDNIGGLEVLNEPKITIPLPMVSKWASDFRL